MPQCGIGVSLVADLFRKSRTRIRHPMTPDEAVQSGIHYHQQGQLELAETLYRQALSVAPDHPDANHLLGLIAMSCGQFEAAAHLISHAIAQKPNEHIFWGNLGILYEKQGNLVEAESATRRALELNPSYVEGYNNLGQILRLLKRLDEAEIYLRKAVQLKPNYSDAWNNLGVLALDRSDFAEASQRLERAIVFGPHQLAAHCNLGIALIALNEHERATQAFHAALNINHDSHLAMHGLATIQLKEGNLDAAIEGFEKALSLNPGYAESWLHFGCALDELDRSEAAVEAFRRALAIEPNNSATYFNLGRVLSRAERYEESILALEKAVELRPDDAEALSLLVNQLQHVCRWEKTDELSRRLIDFARETPINTTAKPGRLVNPSSFSVIPAPIDWELFYRCCRAWAVNKTPAHRHQYFSRVNSRSKMNPSDVKVAVGSGRKIRLGYVSADFRSHVMASHLVELFEVHDRSRFDVFGYSLGPDDKSPIRARIAGSFDKFVDGLKMTPAAIAETIHRDKVDILIDLQGHTLLCRPDIYARKPAPIQVTYLGFAGTTGADYIDYILVDEIVAPAWTQPYFSERLVQLPGCYQVNQSRVEMPLRIPTRAECGLPEEGIVFCAFNNFFKITSAMFDVWMRLLSRIPNSVLWIPIYVPAAVENLQREAMKRGINSKRLVFAPRVALIEHLARHHLADIFLDTFPYNAHGTSSLSLRAGVPIVTMSGETMASRVAGSLLREVGLSELVTQNYEDYEKIAFELATDHERLSKVKQAVRTGRDNGFLFDCKSFARSVERAYEVMVDRYQTSQEPSGFKLDRDGGVKWLTQ